MKNKKKQKKEIFTWAIVIFIIVLVLSLILFGKNGLTKKEDSFLSINLYDQNGNKIGDTIHSLSVVNGASGVYFIDLTVTLVNTGSTSLTCNILSATPTLLNSAISKTEKIIPVGGKVAWTSSLINTSTLESQTDTNFSVIAKCSYNDGSNMISLPQKMGFLMVAIRPSSVGGGYEIIVSTGGTPTEFCGDGVCQVSETSSNCPGDCAVANNVKFRTTDLTYVSGSALAYGTSCGSSLTGYGYSTKYSGLYNNACSGIVTSRVSGCGTATQLLSLPGGWVTGSDGVKLFSCSSKAGYLYVCDHKPSDGTANSEYGEVKAYLNTDSDASKVDTTSTSFDASKEISC